jgi:hypothetical protein
MTETIGDTMEFQDEKGDVWRCRVDVQVLMNASLDLHITLKDLFNYENMNFGALIGLLYYSVLYLAKAKGVSKEIFYKERITPKILIPALTALGNAIAFAFPISEAADSSPLEPDPGKTRI